MKTNSTVTEDEHVNTPSWAKKKYRYRSWIYKYSIMNTHNTVTEHEHVNFTPLWTRTYCNWTWTCIHVSFFPSYVNTIYNINKITLRIKMYILLNREHGYIYKKKSMLYLFQNIELFGAFSNFEACNLVWHKNLKKIRKFMTRRCQVYIML